jgi:hypothetical protein
VENTGRSERFVQDKNDSQDFSKKSKPIVHGVLPVGSTAAQKAQALNQSNSQENG